MTADHPLLKVDGLTKHFPINRGILAEDDGRVRAVDGISFELRAGETFGIVGESGCGKTTAVRTLLRLTEPTDGDVRFDGQDITEYDERELKRFRREAQLLFQDADSSFDPRMSIGESIAEPLIVHGMGDRELRRSIITHLLVRVGLQAEDIDRYPHELSGGQIQRAGLARALVLNPRLLVADEPMSALDVSVQAEMLQLLETLQAEFGLSILLISHNLGVVRHICDRIGVMYLGEFVELGPTDALFSNPTHPYTQALISAIPSTNLDTRGERVRLTGDVPDPANPPRGCRFHTRCPAVIPPEEYTLEQRTWRSLLELKRRVADGRLTTDQLLELLYPGTAESDRPAELQATEVEQALRAEYDLGDPLEDPTAEATFMSAINQLAAGADGEAEATLEAAFPTVCQRSKPAFEEHEPGHWRACHLESDMSH